jgi:hypothetical protein
MESEGIREAYRRSQIFLGVLSFTPFLAVIRVGLRFPAPAASPSRRGPRFYDPVVGLGSPMRSGDVGGGEE